jgi:hypothetical protein
MSEYRLEDELRGTLRREEPPAGFAAKILARTVGGPVLHVVPKRGRSWFQRPVGLAMAAALAALAIVPAVVVEQHRREQARGLKAKQELLTALAITREQFQQAKAKVQRATGEPAGEQR